MVLFGCGCVLFGGYLRYRLVISFVRMCQCYCFGDGCKILYGRWFFPCDVELGGYCGFVIRKRIRGKMSNDMRVREWAYVRVGILVPIKIWGYNYSDCMWVILGRHRSPMDSLL